MMVILITEILVKLCIFGYQKELISSGKISPNVEEISSFL
jgi:hypothetical protein